MTVQLICYVFLTALISIYGLNNIHRHDKTQKMICEAHPTISQCIKDEK